MQKRISHMKAHEKSFTNIKKLFHAILSERENRERDRNSENKK